MCQVLPEMLHLLSLVPRKVHEVYEPECVHNHRYVRFLADLSTARETWGVRLREFCLTDTTTTILRLSGFCLGQPGWAGARRNICPLTPVMVINHPLSASSIYYDPWHPPCSIHVPDSLFPQSLSKFSLACLLAWHFLMQLLSFFHSKYPYHRDMFCSSTEIMSSNPSLSLNPLLITLFCSLMSHILLTILTDTYA